METMTTANGNATTVANRDAKQIFMFEEICPDCGGTHRIGDIPNTWFSRHICGQPNSEIVNCRTCNHNGRALIYRDAEGNRIYVG